MRFDVIQSQLKSLRSQMQEVQSAAYVIMPVQDGYQLISFLDAESFLMSYTLVNSDMIEVKLLSEVPVDVLVSYGKFVEAVERWQSGDIEEFPFSDYVATEDQIGEILRPFTPVAPDRGYDGDEGKLE